jgi:hypothetical protein
MDSETPKDVGGDFARKVEYDSVRGAGELPYRQGCIPRIMEYCKGVLERLKAVDRGREGGNEVEVGVGIRSDTDISLEDAFPP